MLRFARWLRTSDRPKADTRHQTASTARHIWVGRSVPVFEVLAFRYPDITGQSLPRPNNGQRLREEAHGLFNQEATVKADTRHASRLVN
jgi:hypothetical protein